ncbi:MAG TPA: branched-chain amino acid ABC transporter permease [Acidimicrobiales bacterium]
MKNLLKHRGALIGCLALLAFVLLPFAGFSVPWILPGTLNVVNSSGTLIVLALCFLFAGVAVGYDLMIGFTGLLSLGPVLYFASGAYVFDIAITRWSWPLVPALALTFGVAFVLAVLLGAIALRVDGIAFAMVTLAFAQAFYYLVENNPHNFTGGDTGLALSDVRLPAFLSGAVSNTRNLYWVALAFLVVAFIVVWLVTESVTGHVFVAVRENEKRLDVLGIRPFRFKLASFVLSSLIAAGGGVIFILVIGTAVPSTVASTSVTISILIMVVLGGSGTRWGAVMGAMVYVYLQQYLLKVAGEPSFTTLPAVLRVPLSQPQFLLGALFVLFVLFVPGGIAGLFARIGYKRDPSLGKPRWRTLSIAKALKK